MRGRYARGLWQYSMISLTSVCFLVFHICMHHALHPVASQTEGNWAGICCSQTHTCKPSSVGHDPKQLAARAGLLPGKLLDIPLAKPVLWTSTARFMTIALGAATALAVMWLACCTCWFLGFFERVPVKREDDPPVFPDTPEKPKPLAVKVKEVGESATDEEAYIIA